MDISITYKAEDLDLKLSQFYANINRGLGLLTQAYIKLGEPTPIPKFISESYDILRVELNLLNDFGRQEFKLKSLEDAVIAEKEKK
tara:strand:- start:645 stop:902 length:258 start_codon:yes stop_codon:yes gene_type:complete